MPTLGLRVWQDHAGEAGALPLPFGSHLEAPRLQPEAHSGLKGWERGLALEEFTVVGTASRGVG